MGKAGRNRGRGQARGFSRGRSLLAEISPKCSRRGVRTRGGRGAGRARLETAPAFDPAGRNRGRGQVRGHARGRGLSAEVSPKFSDGGVQTRDEWNAGCASLERPSAIDPLFCRMIQDLPRERPLETAQATLLSKLKPPGFISWSSLATITPPYLLTSLKVCKLEPEECEETSGLHSVVYQEALMSPDENIVPASTPMKMLTMPSSSSSSSSRELHDANIANALHWGSEEEDDDEDDDEVEHRGIIVASRAAQMYLEFEDEEETAPQTNAEVCLMWPPLSASSTAPRSPPDSSCLPLLDDYNLTKFNFVWKGFSTVQTPPEERRECLSVLNCGPTADYNSPYDAFCAIWDNEIMLRIAKETNAYTQQLAANMLNEGTMQMGSRITKWRDTNVDELRVYFAIILATGIVVKSRLEEYWNSSQDIFSTPGFTAAMSINRFLLLSKCLHFRSNNECNPESMTRAEAKLFKLQPILDHLNKKFSQLYIMSQNVVLDESLSMWKGRLDINEFIKNEAASVGIKTYEVCESQTGYLWRFEVHAGHVKPFDSQDSPISEIVPALVLRLLDGLENKGYTIWMDNYYNSPALARELKVRGFDCVGTLRLNRQFVPVELTNLSKKDMALGQVSGCTSGDVDLLVWRDKCCVAFISTYHGLATTMCGNTLKPTVVADYNVCMGGVDRKDQIIAMYPIERKRTRIWYKTFFRRLLNVSIFNAYILYRKHHQISHRNFRKSLVQDLLLRHGRPAAPRPALQPNNGGHFPAQYDFLTGDKHERQRRVCQVCKKRTNAYCKACSVPLCVFTCFEPHHTSQ